MANIHILYCWDSALSAVLAYCLRNLDHISHHTSNTSPHSPALVNVMSKLGEQTRYSLLVIPLWHLYTTIHKVCLTKKLPYCLSGTIDLWWVLLSSSKTNHHAALWHNVRDNQLKGKGRALDIAPKVANLMWRAQSSVARIPAFLYLSRYSRYSFTDPERMEGWVSLGPGAKSNWRTVAIHDNPQPADSNRDLAAAGRAR